MLSNIKPFYKDGYVKWDGTQWKMILGGVSIQGTGRRIMIGDEMAGFDIRINNCSRLDWRILINGSVSLYHDEDILKGDMEWLKNENYQLYILDFHIIKTREDFHD